MKWQRLGTVLTFTANVGVIIGLVFLGYETRQNTIQLRAQASYSINQGLDMINSGIYNNAELADIVRRGENNLSSLDSTEMLRFSSYQFSRINLAIHINKLKEDGITEVHFNYVRFLIKEYQTKQGLQDFVTSIEGEWEGSEELYNQLASR